MKDYFKKFIVKPDTQVKLKNINPKWHGKHESHKKALPEIQKHLTKMDALQYLMYSENKHSLLIVLQGLDTAGKDGVIRHVLTGMNPQGCTVSGFKHPTAEEASHDFLWRIHKRTPAKGTVAIFNRSHYEDVLVTRVHNLISQKECAKRYQLINEFEKNLAEENNTKILKFFLHISNEEQLDRFKKRLDEPSHQWKISENDYTERKYWDEYMSAYEDLLRNTSTKTAPWFVIPSDHKWFRNLAISQIITNTLEDFKMKLPTPTADLTSIREKYHKATVAFKKRKASKHK